MNNILEPDSHIQQEEKVPLPEGMTHYVYATDEWRLNQVIETGDLSDCSFQNRQYTIENWTLVGFAKIETLKLDEYKIKENLIASLESQISTIQANSQMEITRLKGKIQELLALPSA